MRLPNLKSIFAGATALTCLASLAWAAVGADSSVLRGAVTLGGVRAHQAALQVIATGNSGTRASGTLGFGASADYVKGKLLAEGYSVSVLPFNFPFFEEHTPAELEQTSPNPTVYTNGTDFTTMEYSGSGNVTALLQNIDHVLPPGPNPSTSNSGCEAADFPASTSGRIALIQRGTCTFLVKAQNAQAAGAVGVIIFNEGQPGRTDLLNGTLGEPSVTIPVVGTTFALGNTLAGLSNVSVRIKTDTTSETRETANVVAESAGGRSDRTVVVGAHLDSVAEGPGINDNGSGSATILEVALQMKRLNINPRNKVRFLWFGAEEAGLLGSEHYVSTLTQTQIKNISVMLNFDMVGSPNFVRFVYDGDGSATPQAGPNGSAVIEDVFLKYFAKADLANEPTAFDGRSDYGPFIAVGIPAGGLFTGAEEIKTAEQVPVYGGTAGDAYDPCYHQSCDTYANNSNTALDQMSDAAADAILQFAMTTSAVKGTSKANDQAVKLVAPEALSYRGSRLQK